MALDTFHSEWTPEEIKGQVFRGGLFGFSRREVRDFLRLMSKLWSRMLDHQKEQHRRIELLEKEVAAWRAKEQELEERKLSVKLQCEQLLCDTEEKADAIRKKTENWLEEVIAKVEETQRQKQNFLTAFRSALDSHYELIRSEEDRETPLSAGLSDILRAAAPQETREVLSQL